MFSKAYSAVIHGIDGLIVSVEADVSNGLPLFDMVGLLNSEAFSNFIHDRALWH